MCPGTSSFATGTVFSAREKEPLFNNTAVFGNPKTVSRVTEISQYPDK